MRRVEWVAEEPVVRAGAGDVPPGGDVVGRVVSSASGSWRAGTRVAGLCAAGAYAERAVLAEAFLAAVPDDVSDDDAVALVRGGQVALGALRVGDAASAGSVLVTAAAGGVGHLAVQLARLLGVARVVAAGGPAGQPERVAVLRERGRPTSSPTRTCPASNRSTSCSTARAATRCHPPCPRSGHAACSSPTTASAARWTRTSCAASASRSVIGFAMPHMVARDLGAHAAHRELLWGETAAGRLRPVVHGPIGFDDAGAAHALLAGRRNVGKVVLAP